MWFLNHFHFSIPLLMRDRMMTAIFWVLFGLASSLLVGNSRAVANDHEVVDFAHEVVPILKKYCLDCHRGEDAKGGFAIRDRDRILKQGIVEAGNADESELIKRLVSDDAELQMPPPERSQLTASEIKTLRDWIDQGLQWEDGFNFDGDHYQAPLQLSISKIDFNAKDGFNPIDRVLALDRDAKSTTPMVIVNDADFFRRVSLDLLGLLPTVEDLDVFVADENPKKRIELVDKLLSQSTDYSDHWITFFNDLLRNDYSGTGFITGGRRQISSWLYGALLENKPYDLMVKELISPPNDESRGFIDGIRWRGEVSAGQTVEIQFAQSVAQAFLSINLKCASCHDSFVDSWTLDDAFGLAAIYSDKPLEIFRCDKSVGRFAQPSWLFPELGEIEKGLNREERLSQLADLVTHPENGQFSRSIVNRIWYQMMGHGIVHPIDAMQNQPWNAELLDLLAVYLINENYDLKALLRLIVTSDAYQLLSVQQPSDESSPFHFEGPVARRLTAEQFLDGVWQITEAGPTKFDAPVVRGASEADEGQHRPLSASWIWGDSASDGKVPAAGESLRFERYFDLPSEPLWGAAVVTCDNSFEIFINDFPVATGDNWEDPQGIAFGAHLKFGPNKLVIVARNGGSTPNPAGLFFEGRIGLTEGELMKIVSDEQWRVTEALNSKPERKSGDGDEKSKLATLVKPLDVWSRAINQLAPRALQSAISGRSLMVRAALLKNNALMKSLGRPMREQITSMRPASLTTLEAMNLSNGTEFAGILNRGAENLIRQSAHQNYDLVDYLYRFAYSREPSSRERILAEHYLGNPIEKERLADLLWTIFMSPEFLLVR